ncbi:MAG TPA: hypothetical protein VGO45_00850 [Bacteroidia bacterium]|jgi:hypothetical protein|nr:hypothetical protein [Bacteroidia bacterium]
MEKHSIKFAADAQHALKLMAKVHATATEEDLLELFISEGIEEKHAIEIIVFLPIAFCRRMITTVSWKDEYIEIPQNGAPLKKKFRDNEYYRIIYVMVDKYFSESPKRDVVLGISEMSAEFVAFNDFVRDGGILENMQPGIPRIVR